AARLYVIPHGVRTRPVTEEQIKSFRTARGLTRDYVLWTGTREPRKNLLGLLRAFALLIEEHDDADGLDLVLVGPAGWGDDAVERNLLARLGDRVHVTGRLDDDELAAAYCGARAFCFPSIWEGFGLPVLEAMAYGAPVVTSAGTCMAEVCGEAGLLADPASPREIAGRLAEAIGPAHDELAEAGRERARTFTWDACAAAHTEVYHALIGGAV
ncbi:glycosyl transferase family 1, partial [Actinomyces naeslundii]